RVATGLGLAALVTLLVPALLLAGSVLAGSTNTVDLAHALAGPSSAHLLGTDTLGRDVLARVLVGYRQTLLIALAGLALAAVVGVAWGALAVLVARVLPRAGGPIAEVILGPGRLVMVAPLLLAGIALIGAARWPVALALAVLLAPRIATAVNDLVGPQPPAPAAAIRTAGGVLLTAWGVMMAVLVGLQLLGIGTAPPAPTPGQILADAFAYLTVNGQAAQVAAVTLAGIAPFLLAGWALLRHPRQAEALPTLNT
ncbi:MAG: hypothetical protein J2P15_23600, partial [Micromonosporaceae bacterium]|nr:hypothetical protein [Micromonosporaceae bacterium]